MSNKTIKQSIIDIYCRTLVFLREQGYSYNHAHTYAFGIVEMYTSTIKNLAACGYLKDVSDD